MSVKRYEILGGVGLVVAVVGIFLALKSHIPLTVEGIQEYVEMFMEQD